MTGGHFRLLSHYFSYLFGKINVVQRGQQGFVFLFFFPISPANVVTSKILCTVIMNAPWISNPFSNFHCIVDPW